MGAIKAVIIEDNQDSAVTLRMFLEHLGFQTDVAYDGESGLALVLSQMPELVVCDIGLPKLDGYQVAAAIRGDSRAKHACLIAVTGYGSLEDIEKAEASGFDRHFIKPLDLDRFEEMVTPLLNG